MFFLIVLENILMRLQETQSNFVFSFVLNVSVIFPCVSYFLFSSLFYKTFRNDITFTALATPITETGCQCKHLIVERVTSPSIATSHLPYHKYWPLQLPGCILNTNYRQVYFIPRDWNKSSDVNDIVKGYQGKGWVGDLS